jgi:hypothetical protein
VHQVNREEHSASHPAIEEQPAQGGVPNLSRVEQAQGQALEEEEALEEDEAQEEGNLEDEDGRSWNHRDGIDTQGHFTQCP